MKQTTYTCDRCGAEIANPHSCYLPTYAIKDYSARIDFYNIGTPRTAPQRIDLCAECVKKFIDFMDGDNYEE